MSVTVVEQANRLTVTGDDPPTLTVTQVIPRLEVSSTGPQGIPGPQGLPGTPGGNGFAFTQSSPAATWIIDHNLGRKVHVTVFDPDGVVVYADLQHGSLNQVTVTFAAPFAGSAVVS